MTGKAIKYEDLVEKLRLLVINTDTKDFLTRVDSVLSEMVSLIKEGVEFSYALRENINGKKTTEQIVYSLVSPEVEENCKVIKDVLNQYLSGNICGSINRLDDWWEQQRVKQTFPYAPIRKDYRYYRIRKKGVSHYEMKDMFHVPFDKRGSVTTRRYSMPGYPCLYLGKSIYVCWEEMRRPALSDFATSAFKAQEECYLLDMRLRKRLYTHDNCVQFLQMLPLLVICALKVSNDDNNFKPEYILPQLLLHIIIVQSQNISSSESDEHEIKIEGIEYNSVVAEDEFRFSISPTTYYLSDCLVLPVKVTKDTKTLFCPNLIKKFLITSPKYYEYEYIKDSLAFEKRYMQEETAKHHNYFRKNYDSSYFSFMERSWEDTDFKVLSNPIRKM